MLCIDIAGTYSEYAVEWENAEHGRNKTTVGAKSKYHKYIYMDCMFCDFWRDKLSFQKESKRYYKSSILLRIGYTDNGCSVIRGNYHSIIEI